MKAQNRLPVPLLLALAAAAALPIASRAQNEAPAATPPNVYKIDIAVTQRDTGQSPTTRRFSLIAEAGGSAILNSSTNVAVAAHPAPPPGGTPQYHYLDIGIDMTCWLKERGDRVQFSARMGITDPVDSQSPVARTTTNRERVETVVTLTPGRPMTVLSWDAAASRRHYEVEVTATRLPAR